MLGQVDREGLPLLPGRLFDVGAGGCVSFGDCAQCRFADDPAGAEPVRNALRLGFAGLPLRAVEPCVARLAGLLGAATQAPIGGRRGSGREPGRRFVPLRPDRLRQA